MKLLKVACLGRQKFENHEKESDLFLRILSRIFDSQIEIVNSVEESDLVIVYPYVINHLSYKLKWLINFLLRKVSKQWSKDDHLPWMLGVKSQKAIFISPENLDRPYWWNAIGQFVIHSKLPRLTFWPQEIDPLGCRFPYWYNYVDWPEYPRNNFYKRFGCLFSIETLMSPLKRDESRKEGAIAIASHLDFPRKTLLENLKNKLPVEIYGRAGINFDGPKIELMQKYRYAFCPENSVGYAYDTEKLPEAWMAGCIPVGTFLNPFSDFNPKVICSASINSRAYQYPLLATRPSLQEIEVYVKKLF